MKKLLALLTLLTAQIGLIANPIIDQQEFYTNVQIQAFEPLGQSFTALGSSLDSISLTFFQMNLDHPNDPITLSLLAGNGLGGQSLGSVAVTVPLSHPYGSFLATDWSGVPLALTVGHEYTFVIHTTSPYWGIGVNTDFNPATPDAYAGGQAYAYSGLAQYIGEITDVQFQIVFSETSSVPDAGATGGLMACSVGALLLAHRRSRRQRALANRGQTAALRLR